MRGNVAKHQTEEKSAQPLSTTAALFTSSREQFVGVFQRQIEAMPSDFSPARGHVVIYTCQRMLAVDVRGPKTSDIQNIPTSSGIFTIQTPSVTLQRAGHSLKRTSITRPTLAARVLRVALAIRSRTPAAADMLARV